MKKTVFSPTFFMGLILTIALGGALFVVSQETDRQKALIEKLKVHEEAQQDRQALLQAEWSYLNRPERVAMLLSEIKDRAYENRTTAQQSSVKVLASMPVHHYAPSPISKPESVAMRFEFLGKKGRE